MRIHYSPEADALYIRLKETDIADTNELTYDIILDYDKDGNIIGIEILSASEHADIGKIALDKMMLEKTVVG
jgi:uncharacterized protein YuzE